MNKSQSKCKGLRIDSTNDRLHQMIRRSPLIQTPLLYLTITCIYMITFASRILNNQQNWNKTSETTSVNSQTAKLSSYRFVLPLFVLISLVFSFSFAEQSQCQIQVNSTKNVRTSYRVIQVIKVNFPKYFTKFTTHDVGMFQKITASPMYRHPQNA